MKQQVLLLLLLPMAIRGYALRKCVQYYGNSSIVNCETKGLEHINVTLENLPNNSTVHAVSYAYNDIEEVEGYIFSKLTALHNLTLHNNKIANISLNAFHGLSNLVFLDISVNKLTRILRGTFKNLNNLMTLDLSRNKILLPDTFRDLSSLRMLDISENKLENFTEVTDSIRSLSSLSILNVQKNNFPTFKLSCSFPRQLVYLILANCHIKIVNVSHTDLKNIQFLDLSGNSISNMSWMSHLDLSNLAVLNVSGNPLQVRDFLNLPNVKPHTLNVSKLHVNASSAKIMCTAPVAKQAQAIIMQENHFNNETDIDLTMCQDMKSLDLSHNQMNWSKKKIIIPPNLLNLTVDYNYLRTLSIIKGDSNLSLQHLSVKFNLIEEVGKLPDFPNLRNLWLHINHISVITFGAFRKFKRLENLRIDNNLITDFTEHMLDGLENLKTLNCRNNKIALLRDNRFSSMKSLSILDLGGNRVKEIKMKAFHGLANLKNLYLDRNRLTRLDYRWFAHLKNLHVLDLAMNELHFHYGEGISPFVHLRNLKMLKLYSQQKEGMEVIPANFFNGLHFLRILYIQNNKLTALQANTLAPLTSLQSLYISEECTGLRALSVDFFRPLAKLHYLDLSNIGLSRIQDEQFQNNTALRTLFLDKNALSFVYEGSLDSLKSLRYIDLSRNQLRCTCANAWFKNWAINNKTVQVVDLYEYRCDTPGAPERPYFVDFDISICYESLLGVKLLEFTGVAVLFTLLSPLAYIKGHWHLKYNYYLFRARFRQFRKKDCETLQRYDAFVSYNSSDEDWVMNYLRPNLEQHGPPFYKLCLHHRDFELGRYIIDNIIDGIYSSRKTICLLSESYLRSDWCSMEVQMAMHRLFNEHKDVLIMVLLEDLPGYRLRTAGRLSRVLGQRTYIVWPEDETAQQLFWAKLRSALRDPSTSCYAEQ
uniref:toll-like receptor 13 n=1 Tax=Myxine glutinosa TaxID=7769 RepID=UPI0035902480